MLLALALAPSTMVAASAAERRWGPGAAGRVGALPVTLAPALLALGSSAGTVASAAASHVPAQVALAIAFVAVLPHGVRAAIPAGVAAYVGVAIATPEAVGLALAVPALAVGGRVLAGAERAREGGAETPGKGGAETTGEGGAETPGGSAGETRGGGESANAGAVAGVAWRTAVVRAGVATALGVAIVGAQWFGGTAAAGLVAGFPALSLTLALLIHR